MVALGRPLIEGRVVRPKSETLYGVMKMTVQPVESLALRPREAAKALGISARTLWGLTAPRGPIPCLRIGHGKRQTVLYPVDGLKAWLTREAEATKGGNDDTR